VIVVMALPPSLTMADDGVLAASRTLAGQQR